MKQVDLPLIAISTGLRKAKPKCRKLKEKQDLWTREMGKAYRLGAKAETCVYQGRQALVTLSDRLKRL